MTTADDIADAPGGSSAPQGKIAQVAVKAPGSDDPSGHAAEFEPGGSKLLDPSDRVFWLGLIVVSLSLISALATFLILTGLTPVTPSNGVVYSVLITNTVLILAMIAIISWQARGLWLAWREKVAGARLHIRIVALFSIIAALPTLLLAVGATTTFSRSLDGWFSKRARAIIENSRNVALAYIDEHGQVIRTDIVNMARDLDAASAQARDKPLVLEQLLIAQAGLRDLPVAYVIDSAGKPIVAAVEDARLPYVPPPAGVIPQAEQGQVPLMMPKNNNRVAAVVKLQKYPGEFLYVARGVSPEVVTHLQRTEQNFSEYEQLKAARFGLKVAHGLMYFMIATTALLAAVWVGLWFAGRFVAPIRRLIGAAQQVSRGDLAVALPERRGEGDLRRLSQTFNTMARELKHQRDALVSANEQLLERRRFMEAVLSGVSAGVLGLDAEGRIRLASRAALDLVDRREGDLIGRPLAEAIPAFGPVLQHAAEPSLKSRPVSQITVPIGSEERTFAVRVTHEHGSEGDGGSVVTFDDVTDLVIAQRTSAWGDVARRIAHEIKNPLTPIILSAERLRRKYAGAITEDRETFERLTATIERQAGDIKTMVDEFAAFARVPKPVMEPADLNEAVRDSVILFRESHPGVRYDLVLPDAPVLRAFDRRLITQALTNLVKNATEAVETAAEADAKAAAKGAAPKGSGAAKGRVETRLTVSSDRVTIEVIDNGVGLPKQNRARLTEPYVTTKGHKGTGLGLAIVSKITEQHGGTLVLEDAPLAPDRPRGALVRLSLPLVPIQKGPPDPNRLPAVAGAA